MKKALFFALVCLFALNAAAQKRVKVERSQILVDARFDAKIPAAVTDFLAPYKAKVDSIEKPLVGRSSKYLSSKGPESELSNTIADAMVWGAKKFYGVKADVAVYNFGGIRADLPAGDVCYGDVLEMLPFKNYFTSMTMTGEQLLELFSQIARLNGQAVNRGVKMVIGENRELESVTIGGKEISPKKKYTVVTIDYLVEGNDGMPAFTKGTNKKTDKREEGLSSSIFLAYCKMKMKAGETFDSPLEGRIVSKVPKTKTKTKTEEVKPLELTILHTNDTHSQVLPYKTTLGDTLKAGRAGLVRVAAVAEEVRKTEENVLIFDSGDFSQGSLYYTLFQGEVEVGLLNKIGVTATTIGNHEFDFGLENMARIYKMANFPVVCCNYDFTGTCLDGIVKPYTLINIKGKKIGVFGVSPKIDGLVLKDNCKGVVYHTPQETAPAVIKRLKEVEKCDMIICLSHLGWDIADPTDDNHFIPATKDVDLVLGGHSHTYLKELQYVEDSEKREVPVDQNGKAAIYIGKLKVKLI